MTNSEIYKDYEVQLDKLAEIVTETNRSAISEQPNLFFINNVNFFTKSFLVNLCAYLESFLKDITFSCVEKINEKVKATKIPYNLVLWSMNYNKEIKENSYKYENLRIGIKKKSLDDHISGSPHRTVKLFRNIGINIESNNEFQAQKEQINIIVIKRNKVLHHNDDASDISFTDIIGYIGQVKTYMKFLDERVEEFKNDSCQ